MLLLNLIQQTNLILYSHTNTDFYDVNFLINFNIYNFLLSQSNNPHLSKHCQHFNSKITDSQLTIQINSTLPNFLFLRQSTITSFFSVNLIDMPICFKKSKSLYSKTFELPLLKFVNLIMRKGYRTKTTKHITRSFSSCFFEIIKSWNNPNYFQWVYLYNSLLVLSYNSNNNFINFNSNIELDLNSKHVLVKDCISFNKTTGLDKILFSKLNDYLPLFSFYIRKVDKSIRKHSRGKSGKYTIMWKYVPIYKRLYITMRWLLKDLKFQKSKSFEFRLIKTLDIFLLTPQISFVCKLRRFTHFFVFQNYKKTLLRNLKTTS
jgi:hypothetical protein